MVLSPRALAFGLLTLVLAWHGAGVPLDWPDECSCEELEALGDASDVELPASEDGADRAHETCPPDCEDCPCCGGVAMLASLSSSAISTVPAPLLTTATVMDEDAPRGEPSGVFRPPRG